MIKKEFACKEIKEIEEMLKSDDFMRAIFKIESLLTRKNPIFVNLDVSSVQRLRREVLLFLFGEQLDLIKTAFFKTKYATDKFNILFLLVEFMPQVQDIEIRQFTDLYLILFYTIRYISSFEGTKEEKDKLANLALKAFNRYDAKEAAKFFILNPVYEKRLEEIGEKYRFYKEYLMFLDRWCHLFEEKKANSITIVPSLLIDEIFSCLILTDEIFSLLNWKYKGRLKNAFLERMNKIEAFILSRINILFEGAKESVKKEIGYIIGGYLKNKKIVSISS